jgi:hypothetical protein
MSNSPILGIGQKQQNYFAPAIEPLTQSNLRLPGGGPGQGSYYYSLGVQSTVPFVTLEGGGSSQKDFSWGELIEVKEGQQVTIKNSSFMKGDIEVVSGLDYGAKPERISVGVDIVGDPLTPGALIRPLFPADTRRCRQAYLLMSLTTGADPLTIAIRGFNKKHSVTASIDGTPIPAPQYVTTFIIPPATVAGQFPLGYGQGLIPGTVMGLFDIAEFAFSIPASIPTINYPLFMYVMEY